MADKNRTLESLLKDESFQSWIANKASEEESRKWRRWLDHNPLNREIYQEALEIWKMGQFKPSSSPNIENELKRLYSRLKLPKSVRGALPGDPRHTYSASGRTNLSRLWIGICVVAVAVILAVIWVTQTPSSTLSPEPEFQVVSTRYGEKTQLNLPDNSIVILNANSTLHYPRRWTTETRRTFKLSGEAYFNVSRQPHGPGHEFVVLTSDGVIRVVGTRFDIYERGDGTRVTLEKGGLEVVPKSGVDEKINPEAMVKLSSGYTLRFRKGDQLLQPQRTNIQSYVTWWEEYFELDQTPFREIVKRLEETYGIHIKVRDKDLLNRTLSGSIENQNLDILLEALSKVLQVPIHRDGNMIVFGKTPA